MKDEKEAKGKTPKGKGKAKGKGTKSGPNARPAGKSDDEIKVLSVESKTRAAVPAIPNRANWTDEEKEAALSYIVDERRWPDFKINQATIFNFVRFQWLLKQQQDLQSHPDLSKPCQDKDI